MDISVYVRPNSVLSSQNGIVTNIPNTTKARRHDLANLVVHRLDISSIKAAIISKVVGVHGSVLSRVQHMTFQQAGRLMRH